jgi:hypothetical protein
VPVYFFSWIILTINFREVISRFCFLEADLQGGNIFNGVNIILAMEGIVTVLIKTDKILKGK